MSKYLPGYTLKADITQYSRHVSKVPTTEVALSLNHLVGEREKRPRDREAERRSLRSPHGRSGGLVRGFQRFTSQKKLFRPMGWGKLATSFWCDAGSASGSIDGARLT